MTGPTTSGKAFAAANAAMVRGVDGASTVHVLLADCVELMGADTAGILIHLGEQGNELLAATSHAATALELYQSQAGRGPCVEAIETGRSVFASGADELTERWPDFGRAMTAATLTTVHAEPMRWHGRVLGGVNLFWTATKVLSRAEQELAQAFADICSLALMQLHVDDPGTIGEQMRSALQGRVVIERAKGVLAQREDLDMGEAFARLVQLSRDSDVPLATLAQQILADIGSARRS